jgi:hypothetical protein
MKSGEKTRLPGDFDAFPTPDEAFLVVAKGMLGIELYEINKPAAEPLFKDPAMEGYYQSCGVKTNHDGTKSYRVMIDTMAAGFVFKDYTVSSDSRGSYKFKSTDMKQLCSNLKQLSLPMLSKDGSRLAAYNADTQSTNIYQIDSETGNCQLEQNLGIGAGKADFSFDGKFITYSQVAVSSFENRRGDYGAWMRKPKSDMVSNIYIRDLKTGAVKALTHYTSTNVLYPSFNAKGEVIARKYTDQGAEFLKLDPNRASENERDVEVSKSCTCDCDRSLKSLATAFTLGSLFLDFCSKSSDAWNSDGIILLGKDLSSAQCKHLAQRFKTLKAADKAHKAAPRDLPFNAKVLDEISEADLLAACP